MIISKHGETYLCNGTTYRIGDHVVGTDASEYAGLNGTILEIRDGDDRETENETPDIYCAFEPPVLPADVKRLEEVFSKLYQTEKKLADIALDMVIVSPEMVYVPSVKHALHIYMVEEDYAVNDWNEHTVQIFPSLYLAKADLNRALATEMDEGIVLQLRNRAEFIEESSDMYYECWTDGRYCTDHYLISITEVEVPLTESELGSIGRMYENRCRFEDFAQQVETWEDVAKLSPEMHQKFITDPCIPELIDKQLGDLHGETYWEAVSEAAATLISKYLKD